MKLNKIFKLGMVVLILISVAMLVWGFSAGFANGSEALPATNVLLTWAAIMICVALFCTHKWGWGLEKFYEEANTGNGFKMPKAIAWYLTYVLPAIILLIYIIGLCKRFL